MNKQDIYDYEFEIRSKVDQQYKNNVNNFVTAPSEKDEKYYESPYMMENSTATFFYIVAIIIGSLFKDRILVYIIATIIWWKYITRYKN